MVVSESGDEFVELVLLACGSQGMQDAFVLAAAPDMAVT
jgi:hypothetical protein